jgi:PadR family transcriptional regulator PadR
VVRLHQFGFDELREGTVYPALTRLEKKGLLESRLVPSDSGPARKYYRPTASGLSELKEQRRTWADLVHHVNRTLDGHPNERTQTESSDKDTT